MRLLLTSLLLFTATLFANTNEDVWPYLQESMFGDRQVAEVDVNELAITGPVRASSGAQVPVTITVDTDRFVKIYLLIDNNPFQKAAEFDLTKANNSLGSALNSSSAADNITNFDAEFRR